MKYNNILITGGAGFIGSALSAGFKKKYPGLRVIALDNLKRRGSESNVRRIKEQGVHFIHADIRCPEDLNALPPFDLMIECSAETSILAGYGQNPMYMINTNLFGAVNCFELARRNKADIIFLSTSRVYPCDAINSLSYTQKKTRFAWKDNHKVEGFSKYGISSSFATSGPKTLYGSTKFAAEDILREYCAVFGIRCVINRCGVIAGPGQFGRLDQGVFTHWMISHYFKRKLAYIGFGGEGKQVRDLLHIDDLFTLIDKQICRLSQINGRIYNVGGGSFANLSLREASELCATITGNSLNIDSEKTTRPGDIRMYISDTTSVSRECGWCPAKKPREIMNDIFMWIKAHADMLSDCCMLTGDV